MRASEFITEAVKQRLDPKCWTGKHKEGTKIKGGVRVNNCVPNESVAEGSVKDINDIVEKYCAQQGITRNDLTNYDVKQLSKLSDLPTYYIRDQLIKTSPGVTEGEVVPFRRSPTQSAWQKITPDVLQLANDWFWANEDSNGLQAVMDPNGLGNGIDNDLKYIQAKLQTKGWTIDFDDEIDNIVLTNRSGQTVALPVNDAYDGHGWAEGTLDETAAWQKKSGKNKNGGLNKKGVASYRKEHPGSKLQTAVTTKPSKLKPGSKSAERRKSFCARMKGMKKHNTSAKTAHDPDSRINKSLRKWNCE